MSNNAQYAQSHLPFHVYSHNRDIPYLHAAKGLEWLDLHSFFSGIVTLDFPFYLQWILLNFRVKNMKVSEMEECANPAQTGTRGVKNHLPKRQTSKLIFVLLKQNQSP